jgi:tetratricopeptide (TPR) repeat protein
VGLGAKVTSPQAYYNLGLVYYEQRQLEIAISEFQAAIHIDSKLAAADYNLGLALRDTAISSTAGEERAKLLEDAWRAFAEGSKLAPATAKYADRLHEMDSQMQGHGHCPPT